MTMTMMMMVRKPQSTLILLKRVKWRHETIGLSTYAYKQAWIAECQCSVQGCW